jgi:hypothetical protein
MSSVRRFQIVLISILSVVGCRYVDRGVPGSGVAKTETRDLGNFEVVDFSGAGTLELTIGLPARLTITADDNLLPLIETTVRDGRLLIGSSQSINPKTGLVVHASATDIKSVNISGAATTIVTGINNESFTIDLSGSGSIKLAGKTDRLTLSVSGAASTDATNLQASSVVVGISGSGSAKVQARETLNANVSGSGSITYIGNPKVEQNISGVGSVRKTAGPLQAEAETSTR